MNFLPLSTPEFLRRPQWAFYNGYSSLAFMLSCLTYTAGFYTPFPPKIKLQIRHFTQKILWYSFLVLLKAISFKNLDHWTLLSSGMQYFDRYISTFRRNTLPPSSGHPLFQTLIRIIPNTHIHSARARIQKLPFLIYLFVCLFVCLFCFAMFYKLRGSSRS
jgi:hypothetical protein